MIDAELINAPLTLVDLSGAPMGFTGLSRLVGSLIIQLLTAGVFARNTQNTPHRVLLAIDEWQELVKTSHEEVERLLALARFKKVGLALANQTMAQISDVSKSLTQSVLTNVSTQIHFRPQAEDIRHLLPLIPASGAMLHPRHPGRLLSEREEKQHFVDLLSRLPPRHCFIADRLAGKAFLARTLTLPYAAAKARSRDVGPHIHNALAQGRFGRLHSEMALEARPTLGPGAGVPSASARSKPSSISTTTRPPLKLRLPK